MPVWLRMLNRVMFADSSATFASRMRLSAAFLLVICDCASVIANWSRFCSVTDLALNGYRGSRCRVMFVIAVCASVCVEMSSALMPRPFASTSLIGR